MARESPTESQDRELLESGDPEFANYRVLIVSLDSYKDPEVCRRLGQIRGADDDAEKLCQTLLKIGYSRESITWLHGPKATRKTILQRVGQLEQMTHARCLLIFWAGHGVADRFGRSFLLPYDADLRRLAEKAVSVDWLVLRARIANAHNKAIFLDTCFADPRHVSPQWDQLGAVGADASVAFVGASTYLALAQAGRGGILTICLLEALEDVRTSLCDDEGRVHLDGVIAYLQRYLRPRAAAAWKATGKLGEGPQNPYIVYHPGEPVLLGRNVAVHVKFSLDHSDLPHSVKKLAAMVINTHWAGGDDR